MRIVAVVAVITSVTTSQSSSHTLCDRSRTSPSSVEVSLTRSARTPWRSKPESTVLPAINERFPSGRGPIMTS